MMNSADTLNGSSSVATAVTAVTASKTYNRTMWGLLTRLVGWASPLSTPPTQVTNKENGQPTEEDLAANWEWMMSKTEEIALKQEQLRASEIKEELQKMNRISGSIRYRPKIGSLVKDMFCNHEASTIKALEDSRLDASKRDRILRDTIRQIGVLWLPKLITMLPPNKVNAFRARWPEQTYKKNISGEMVAMAFYASHPSSEKGLTPIITSDILWSIYICLSRELTAERENALNEEESDLLIMQIIMLTPILIDLWHKTTISVGTISNREGRLPQVWAVERQREQERLDKLKSTGVSARYNDGPSDVLWKNHQDALKEKVDTNDVKLRTGLKLIETSTYAERKNLLASSLFVHVPKAVPKAVPKVVPKSSLKLPLPPKLILPNPNPVS